LAGGLYVPDDAVVYPPVVCRWYLEKIKDAGGLLLRDRVERIESDGKLILASGETLSGETVVNAAGVYAGKLTPNLPIRYKKGHLVITDRYPGFVQRQLIELGYLKKAHDSDGESVAFNVQPRPTGQLLIGSSRQYDAKHREVDRKILGKMIDAAVAYLPGLADLQALRCWTGFRAATPDVLPLIGPSPEQPGVLLATGHEGLGITTSLGTAELIASAITGKSCSLDHVPYLPGRFAA
jgi:glycine/D-amino acid oxidase-like deaminating enzyme